MMTNTQNATICDVAVIGAGPAGLMAAISAARGGARVRVFEKLPAAGRKLLASGGGHCNAANTASAASFMAAFGRQGRFMEPVLRELPLDRLVQFFDSIGVRLVADGDGRYMPETQSAKDVLDALLLEANAAGVTVSCGDSVRRLDIRDGRVAGIFHSTDTHTAARAVILATGGRGYPDLGGGTSGYDLARQAGHSIREPLPALTGVQTHEGWPGTLAGIVVDPAEVRLEGRARFAVRSGALLFTHHGVSGPAVIDLAGDVAELIEKGRAATLRISLLPGRVAADILEEWARLRLTDGSRRLRSWLKDLFPVALADRLLMCADIPADTMFAYLTAPGAKALAGLLTETMLHVRETDGFDRAMVTRGGIVLRDVEPRSLESRLVGGLFFCGEALDLDGPCGGYNLQWAFSSGLVAGRMASAQVHAGEK